MFDIYMQQAVSSLEKTVLRLIKEQGVKLPVEMHKVVSKDGEPIAEADLYYEPKIVCLLMVQIMIRNILKWMMKERGRS
jgi:hypothetical protein